MKQASIYSLRALLGEISACDLVVYMAECCNCSRTFGDEHECCCDVYRALDAMGRAADIIKGIPGVQDA